MGGREGVATTGREPPLEARATGWSNTGQILVKFWSKWFKLRHRMSMRREFKVCLGV
jgi:hypothetical protein